MRRNILISAVMTSLLVTAAVVTNLVVSVIGPTTPANQ
jgi:hypothetical protein